MSRRTRPRRRGRQHPYLLDPAVPADHRGRRRCRCGRLESSDVHSLPERSADERAAEARRLGERLDD